MIGITVETAEEEEAVLKALKAIPPIVRFAIFRPGGGGEYAEEPHPITAG